MKILRSLQINKVMVIMELIKLKNKNIMGYNKFIEIERITNILRYEWKDNDNLGNIAGLEILERKIQDLKMSIKLKTK